MRRPHPIRSVLAALLASACAHPGPAPPPATPPEPPAAQLPASPEPPPDRVGPVRAEVESLLTAQGELLWRSWTTGENGDPARALEERGRLLDPASLAAVEEALGAAAGDEQRALQLLRGFLLGERLARDTVAAAEALAVARAQATFSWDGREVGLRRAPALLAAEASAGRRAALEKALVQATARLAPAEAEYRRALDAAARALGREGAIALAGELRGDEAAALAERAEGVLELTGPPYRVLMEDLARRELALPLDRLRGRDLPRLFALAQDPRAFPAGKASERALATLRELGIDLAARPGVLLDLETRPGKDPRPLLLPVQVPGGVRVAASPVGGAAETRALLRALGGAAFLVEIRAPGLEVRRLGTVTTDVWAGLFEELAGNPAWLLQQTGLGEHNLEPVVRASAARRLHLAREAAAHVLYEVARAREPEKAAEAARAVCQRAFARPVEPEEASLFAAEPDPLLRAADALAAQLLAAQAESQLVRLGGSAWWRSEKAAAFLRAAFSEGARLAPGELSRALGAEKLDAAALAYRARARGEASGVRGF